jgi:4-diphosphocytidyl-2-C-methyl-D-erythritol kinase
MAGKRLLCVRAPAKINLSLRVLRRIAGGYHELMTVFQSIALHDTLTFEAASGPFRLECDDPACPIDRTNLVWRAAETMARAAGGGAAPRDVAIRIAKRIPIAAGLGGGSSDAAAALRGFAALWRVKIPRARMQAMAAALGADVPFFLEGGTVLGLERGDRLFPLIDPPRAWVTLVIPSFGVNTKDAYAWFDQAGPGRRRARPGARTPGTGVGPYERANDLQAPVVRRHPEIGLIRAALERAGAIGAAMSGSGSAVFGMFPTRAAAERAARALAGRSRQTLVTRTLNRRQYQALAAP